VIKVSLALSDLVIKNDKDGIENASSMVMARNLDTAPSTNFLFSAESRSTQPQTLISFRSSAEPRDEIPECPQKTPYIFGP
jgi:hypothetical protein